MPAREDLKRVAILGSGPIRIGQAAEFDFSGTQACRALRSVGIEVILINSNPATIQTDIDTAERVYIEPLAASAVAEILEIERPDALLAGMGGQTGLNLASELALDGVLERLDIELVGSNLEVIETAEDRHMFGELCKRLGLRVPEAYACTNIDEVLAAAEEIGRWPLLVRPAFTLGGLGGGTANNQAELVEISLAGMRYSRIHQVLVEESLLGWQEYEYEVMRDKADNAIIVCSMENLDPMGVHTGESIVVAPVQTLCDAEHQEFRDASLTIVRALDLEGGCNVQFAFDPHTGDWRVIEVNPRVSRSSALASKATGYPIARIAALIAVGFTLDEIPNPILGGRTTAAFEPSIDYCVVKIPRWPFDKFRTADRSLGTSMKSTGEVMAIGRSFEEAVLKAIASLEQGPGHPRPLMEADAVLGDVSDAQRSSSISDATLIDWMTEVTDRRLFGLFEAFRRGWSVDRVRELTAIVPWFLHGLEHIAQMECHLVKAGAQEGGIDDEQLLVAKRLGFTDRAIADALLGHPTDSGYREAVGAHERLIRARRWQAGLHPSFRMVDSCAAEFVARTPYFYSTWEPGDADAQARLNEPEPPVVVIGSGPIRIGQGIEFDCSSVHAVRAARDLGRTTVMINNNPETVSTDFDISDRLYFEPLTSECLNEVLIHEGAGDLVIQFGGQTAIDLALAFRDEADSLSGLGVAVRLLGSSLHSVETASDRSAFHAHAASHDLPIPMGGFADTPDVLHSEAARIGFPILVRPSHVLGGRGMEILEDEEQLRTYIEEAWSDELAPLLVDAFLQGATEIDVDAVRHQGGIEIGAIMEHLEEVGIHSGDSTCFIPPQTLSDSVLSEIDRLTRRVGESLDLKGLYNIQMAIQGDQVTLIEVNPRGSRTVPFVDKATGRPLARWAMEAMLDEQLSPPRPIEAGLAAVKAPVFPFLKLRGLDPAPGPEMKSTGEVMGIARRASEAYLKARMATELPVPVSGGAYITVRDDAKDDIIEIARDLADLGFDLMATRGTCDALRRAGLTVMLVHRISEGASP
ncbi:MAG TPA: carbamoyl-phosphate synthase large subunit, partial [Candidatus Poseidoniales archaeon]|nr:carbamoyl-phosphate synthase large subunit [Candidatus Poseidoniales archaeon]